uniref:Uncharacterized protein n=1 Tax=Picea glauca TaxID=3330 RepID=A0A117NIV8_PICGL|nr:hypothetical protein ABT39_MTgene415 [Picea glauca]
MPDKGRVNKCTKSDVKVNNKGHLSRSTQWLLLCLLALGLVGWLAG